MKYTIDYGCGVAVLYTPYDCEERFYILAETCFGIRKSILKFEILKAEDVDCDDFERLEFNGDIYIWREDGARKMLMPDWGSDKDWDTYYCKRCRYRGEEYMTINEYQERALRTESHPEGEERTYEMRLLQGLMGLCGESGEAMDMLKKAIFQGHELNKEHLAKELGDISWYLAVSADAIGYDLEKVFRMNIEKLKARYPDGFDPEKSINRDENDI